MRKNKFLLIALAVAGMFTACSEKDDVVKMNQENGISFRLQGGMPSTKATATTAGNVNAFAVYGIDDVAAAGSGVNIFEGITVARQLNGTFDYNPKKYYSMGAVDAEFFAFSPVSAFAKISNLDATDLYTEASFDYEVVVPDATGNTVQEDLLVAGTSVTIAPATAVSLDFSHALSRIFVKATNTLSDDIVIKGLTLKNLNSTGTITGTIGTPWTWAWSAQADPIDYEYILATTGVAVQAGVSAATLVTSMEQGMLVLPQATAANNGDNIFDTGEFALEVTYDVANLTNQKGYVFLTSGFSFVENTQYAITITFSGLSLIEINFDITVSSFTDDATYPL